MKFPVGAATGIGSMPGVDIVEAQRIVLGELPDLPHLPELPARGPGADMIGRGASFLIDMPIELYAGRWRIAAREGRDLRIARDFLDRDRDTLTEQAASYDGLLKIQAVGPWTLAAALNLPIGGPLLRDVGAARDLAGSLAEGLRAHIADIRARLPQATVLLQLDEPSLPAVLAAQIPTESGFGTIRSVSAAVARDALTAVISAVDTPVVVHCCAREVPFALLREAGVSAVSVDMSLVDDLDALGETIDAGTGLFAGVGLASPGAMADVVRSVWRKLGFPGEQLAGQVVMTPACGLPEVRQINKVLTAYREAGRDLVG